MKKLVCLMLMVLLALSSTAALAGDDVVTIWANGSGGTVTDWENNRILQEIEAKTGVDIQMVWIPDGYGDQLNAAAASHDMPDIISCYDHTQKTVLQMWVDGGIVAPVAGEVAEAAPNWVNLYETNPYLSEIKFNDEIYLCPVSWGTENAPNMGLIHVRGDLMEKYGFERIDTFDQYVEYLQAAVDDGSIGLTFSGKDGLSPAVLNVILGGMGLPYAGWVKGEDGNFTHWSMQPEVATAIATLRDLIEKGLVDSGVWSCDADTARTNYVSGLAASFVFNGGGHIGRLQNDMTLVSDTATEALLPALDFGNGVRGYTQEDMFWGGTLIGNTDNCDPVLAAKVIDFLISDEGYELCAIGVEGEHFTRNGDEIEWLDKRYEDGFPTESLDAGAHPLASGIVSWQPQEWQDFTLLYGKGADFKAWYETQRENQLMYQTPCYGRNVTTPAWTEFQATSGELYNRYAIEAVNASSADEVAEIWDRYMAEWLQSGGQAATEEMDALLKEIYE